MTPVTLRGHRRAGDSIIHSSAAMDDHPSDASSDSSDRGGVRVARLLFDGVRICARQCSGADGFAGCAFGSGGIARSHDEHTASAGSSETPFAAERYSGVPSVGTVPAWDNSTIPMETQPRRFSRWGSFFSVV